MTTVLLSFAGLLLGGLINWAADVLPRYARQQKSGVSRPAAGFRVVALELLTRKKIRRQTLAGDRSLLTSLAVEGLMVTLLLLIEQAFPPPAVKAAVIGLAAVLVLIALIDLKYRLVLNVVLLPAMLVVLAGRFILLEGRLESALLGGGVALGLFALAKVVSRGALGGGDIKLATFLGLLFGLPDIIWVLLIAVLAGGITTVMLLFVQRKGLNSQIAYAPYLCLGGLVLLFF